MSEPETTATASSNTFHSLSLSDSMLASLDAAGYVEPTPIQAGLIPRALSGVDILGQARTGTGKTAAFAIPTIERLRASRHAHSTQVLVLVPTRELAVQVKDEYVKLGHGHKLHVVAVYGGKPIKSQMEKLQRGADVVVGTPGRVLDHMGRGTLRLNDVWCVVLDEADRMLDIGFRPDIEKILRQCPKERQTLLLSATVPGPVERLARRYMNEPETLNFSTGELSVETIDQYYFSVDPERKFELLLKLLKRENPRQSIIFCRTKRGTEKVYRQLDKKKIDGVECIHGDLAQRVRDRVMAAFRAGEVQHLVATDVVGRGIDVSGISHIINYDIPAFCDDYVHRVGRTGRMGREGVAYTFVTPEEGAELTKIEMRIDRLLKRDEIEGFEPTRRREPQPHHIADDGAAAAQAAIEKPKPIAPPLPGYGRTRRFRRAL